jgi:titin
VPEEPDEEDKPKQAPVFARKPDSVIIEEGRIARFTCRVIGHPKPRVMWLVNGHTVLNVRHGL